MPTDKHFEFNFRSISTQHTMIFIFTKTQSIHNFLTLIAKIIWLFHNRQMKSLFKANAVAYNRKFFFL